MKFARVFGRNVMVSLGGALAVLIMINVMSYRSALKYNEAAQSVKRTYRVLNALESCTSSLVSVESEVRGYAITDDPRYLALFESAERKVDAGLVELKKLIVDPISLNYAKQLEELARSRLARLELTLKAMQKGGIEEVRKVSGPGKDLMDEFREIAALIEERQLQLLKERDDLEVRQSRKNLAAILLASGFAVALLLASMFILGQQLRRKEQLELEVLEISEREQRRIGQDLHDGVCQQLTGISLLGRSLSLKLSDSLAEEAEEIVRWINECIEQTRRVTRGLHPVPNEPSGLAQALRELAENVGTMGKLACRFVCPQAVAIPESNVATNLYRIAQEACQNALRHASPQQIEIQLTQDETGIRLTVTDDGCGFPKNRESKGMGLEIMAHRANSIGASLEVRPGALRGTVVTCTLPVDGL